MDDMGGVAQEHDYEVLRALEGQRVDDRLDDCESDCESDAAVGSIGSIAVA
jgi:hypothetical protein